VRSPAGQRQRESHRSERSTRWHSPCSRGRRHSEPEHRARAHYEGESNGGHTPTDDELNTYIRARLALLSIDISVLPESTQTSLLSSCRGILRGTVVTISSYTPDIQENAPVMYTAPQSYWATEEEERKSLRQSRKELGYA